MPGPFEGESLIKDDVKGAYWMSVRIYVIVYIYASKHVR